MQQQEASDLWIWPTHHFTCSSTPSTPEKRQKNARSPQMAEHTRKCSKCRKTKEVTPQTWKAPFKEGGIHLTSINDPEKENEADNPTEDATDASEFIGVPAMVIDAFLDALTAADWSHYLHSLHVFKCLIAFSNTQCPSDFAEKVHMWVRTYYNGP
ncbi:hypothetical protein R3P38DRAFT_3600990 [Favolaschia claudopus]|uniref:Uncharacterized protein n=1 Tax=Favolaschia claudopus TaxID=2862362 RepID=A0AAW0ADK2_9AGAR